jgi:hypothetical protein
MLLNNTDWRIRDGGGQNIARAQISACIKEKYKYI